MLTHKILSSFALWLRNHPIPVKLGFRIFKLTQQGCTYSWKHLIKLQSAINLQGQTYLQWNFGRSNWTPLIFAISEKAASLLRSSVSATCWILRKLSPVPEGATKPKWSIIILVVSIGWSCCKMHFRCPKGSLLCVCSRGHRYQIWVYETWRINTSHSNSISKSIFLHTGILLVVMRGEHNHAIRLFTSNDERFGV